MSAFNQSRGNIIRLLFIALFLVIIGQLFNLQILSGKYRQLALDNVIYPKRIHPNRGIIFDRKGRAILNNSIMYDLTVTPSQVKNIDTLALCKLLSIDTAEFRKRMREARFKNGPVRPTIFQDLLPPGIQAKLEENIYRFSGFTLVERPVRIYPFNTAGHLLGYIDEVDTGTIRRSRGFYQLGDYAGRSGLENYYEKILMGKRGMKFLIKDNKNRLKGPWEDGRYDTMAVAGRNMRSYLDIELQELAEKLMTNKVGAVVALDPKTGGIIAMASAPNFNPNDLAGPYKQKNLSRLMFTVSSPLFNRAIKGEYPPGSTYKPLGALIGLDEGVINAKSSIACRGGYYACRKEVKCEEHWAGHAASLRLAIAWSCNSFFSNTFRLTVDNPQFHDSRIGMAKWKDYLNLFGLGHRLGVDLPSENAGLIPDTSLYNHLYRGSWNSCTTISLAIGQDKMSVTPLQMANAISIVANKGYFYTPHLIREIDGETKEDTILNRYRQKHEVVSHISDEDFETVISGMQDVVDGGTGKVARIPGIKICAKTGTAENYLTLEGKKTKLASNSMFVCFAPRENPKIAIAVVVQNAGYGATWAGPIASLIMEKYLNDTLRAERIKEVDRITATNLMPFYLPREQFRQDSIRAFKWFIMTRDSNYIRKYIKPEREGPARTFIMGCQIKDFNNRLRRLSQFHIIIKSAPAGELLQYIPS